jgi:hypothetical protein
MAMDDIFGEIPITKPCEGCGKHFHGVISLCQQCEEDRAFYASARKRGDKRRFIPYQQLFKEWQERRKECRSLRTAAHQAAIEKSRINQLEQEKRYLLLALNNTLYDKNLLHAVVLAQRDAEDFAKERDRLKGAYEKLLADMVRLNNEYQTLLLKSIRDQWNRPASFTDSHPKGSIPQEMWRRLMQLVHPDKHGGSETAKKVAQWLLEQRPTP